MTRWDAESEIAIQNEIVRQQQEKLLANNLKRIERLTRRGLLLFLDLEHSKSNTERLRSRARLEAIRTSNRDVDLDLARIEWQEREP